MGKLASLSVARPEKLLPFRRCRLPAVTRLAVAGAHTEKCYLSWVQTLKGTIMRKMFSGSIIGLSIAGAAVAVYSLGVVGTRAQSAATSGSASTAATLKTPWGEPDLQGIWTDETDTPKE